MGLMMMLLLCPHTGAGSVGGGTRGKVNTIPTKLNTIPTKVNTIPTLRSTSCLNKLAGKIL